MPRTSVTNEVTTAYVNDCLDVIAGKIEMVSCVANGNTTTTEFSNGNKYNGSQRIVGAKRAVSAGKFSFADAILAMCGFALAIPDYSPSLFTKWAKADKENKKPSAAQVSALFGEVFPLRAVKSMLDANLLTEDSTNAENISATVEAIKTRQTEIDKLLMPYKAEKKPKAEKPTEVPA